MKFSISLLVSIGSICLFNALPARSITLKSHVPVDNLRVPKNNKVPSPPSVPGKEYSDKIDIDRNSLPDREQTLLWDGNGNVTDGFDYGDEFQVNAMANIRDALFYEVIENRVPLLFSTSGDKPAPILYEKTNGKGGIWATVPQINKNGVRELDGLEVWGPDEIPDANRYSLENDPIFDATGRRIAVHNDVSLGVGFRNPAFYVDELAAAIGLDSSLWNRFDLDGLMTYDDDILFSIAPVGDFDGGEIWTWKKGGGAAQFLNHGGHLWDTAFDVRGTFGTASENVDALEAVATPEPSQMLGFLTLGGLATVSFRKRNRLPAELK
jgi:hypothetical protein